MKARNIGVSLSLLAMTGCNAALEGRPDFPSAGMLPPESQAITAAASATSFNWSTSSNCNTAITDDNTGSSATNSPTYIVARDNCIYEFLGAIDYQYDLYKEQVFKLANGLNASADTLTTVLSAGATGVGGSTGRILSGVAASIGSLKGTINQDVLYNQTITAIIAKMDADRAEKLSTILQQMQPPQPPAAASPAPAAAATKSPAAAAPAAAAAKSPAAAAKSITGTAAPASGPSPPYTMYAASVDLLGYFEAGTVHHAIVDLQTSAGAQATSCRAAVNNIKTTGNASGAGPKGTASSVSQSVAAGC